MGAGGVSTASVITIIFVYEELLAGQEDGKILLHRLTETGSQKLISASLTSFNQITALPTYADKNTTKKGVTRSLMPWTYPLAGCRMAQMYRILSNIYTVTTKNNLVIESLLT